MPDPKVTFSTEKNPQTGSTRVYADIDAHAFASIGSHHLLPTLIAATQQAVVDTMTQDFLRDHRDSILAAISPQTIATLVVAKVGAAIVEQLSLGAKR